MACDNSTRSTPRRRTASSTVSKAVSVGILAVSHRLTPQRTARGATPVRDKSAPGRGRAAPNSRGARRGPAADDADRSPGCTGRWHGRRTARRRQGRVEAVAGLPNTATALILPASRVQPGADRTHPRCCQCGTPASIETAAAPCEKPRGSGGFPALVDHRRDVIPGVVGAVAGLQEVVAGRIVHRVVVEVASAQGRLQRGEQRSPTTPRPALVGTAGKDELTSDSRPALGVRPPATPATETNTATTKPATGHLANPCARS